ncbi:MAG: ATP-binding protein [Bacteroidota bacterium]
MKKILRTLSSELKRYYNLNKVLVVIGARQVGKTTLLKELTLEDGNTLWLNGDDPATRERLTEISIASIKRVVGEYKTVVIDEVQRIKNPGLLLKMMVDNMGKVQFIATGSSSLEIAETIFEPLTGRQFLFRLHPFTLEELYKGKSVFEIEQELPFHLIYGCYPEVSLKRDISEKLLENIAEQYLYKDVLIWKDIRKPQLLDKLLKLLAFQIGSEVSVSELANSMKVKSETVETYIDLLEKSFVIFRLKSFSNNPRKEVSKMSKIYFWDNGIRNAVIGNFNDLSQRNDQGELFENFIISERMKMNTYFRPKIKSYFWRTYKKSEVDYIEVEGDNVSAFEIKWNMKKKHRISKAFINAYPQAATKIITPVEIDFILDYGEL